MAPAKKVPAKKAAAKKAAAKKTPAKKTTPTKAPDTLRVRMYRVGFGDFFLITVPSDAGPQHILVDCGVFQGTSHTGDIATIKTAVRHMVAETGSKLALLIVTHRHADHIIGFSRCATEFKTFKNNVDAIWMSVWETEYETKVEGFQEELTKIAKSMQVALAGRQDPITEDIQSVIANATGEGPGGGTNAASLKLLKTGLGVKPQYLAKGDTPKLPAALINAGLSVEILGPPPVDEVDYLKLMDLKKGVGQYLDDEDDDAASAQRLMPFSPEYVATADDYPVSAFREWRPRTKAPTSADFQRRYPKELQEGARTATPAALLTAAKTLNDNLNNQSLVVLFGWNGKTLLFAGDAQGGNWEYWLYGASAPAKDTSDLTLSSEGAEVLRDIDFYKVGHHGSTNATPMPAVEAMGKGFVSLCSTQDRVYGTPPNTEVPHLDLLHDLAQRSALVRSDQIAVDVGDLHVPAAVKAKLPTPKNGTFEVGSCYVDYLL
jgi:beta-lactamase superfamily II metal-dependent hydrolase